jgi:hypothetical protein
MEYKTYIIKNYFFNKDSIYLFNKLQFDILCFPYFLFLKIRYFMNSIFRIPYFVFDDIFFNSILWVKIVNSIFCDFHILMESHSNSSWYQVMFVFFFNNYLRSEWMIWICPRRLRRRRCWSPSHLVLFVSRRDAVPFSDKVYDFILFITLFNLQFYFSLFFF